jgi:hypothetical protein
MNIKSALLILLLTVGPASIMAADETPSGTLTIDETQVSLIVGGDVGGGVLVYGDDSYSFKTKGLKIGGIGVHKIHMVGMVYHLDDIKDFPGLYGAVEAGVTVADLGKGAIALRNDNGVVIHLKSSAEGLALAVGAEGLHIEMKD